VRLTVNIDLDNEAFTPCPGPEIRRILRVLSDHVGEAIDSGKYLTVFDINGNDIGRWKVGAE